MITNCKFKLLFRKLLLFFSYDCIKIKYTIFRYSIDN